jgi:hypothetical protein
LGKILTLTSNLSFSFHPDSTWPGLIFPDEHELAHRLTPAGWNQPHLFVLQFLHELGIFDPKSQVFAAEFPARPAASK